MCNPRSALGFFVSALALATAMLFPYSPARVAGDPQQEEFFEKKIRPVLVEKCYLCHSASSKPPMGGFRLDARETLLKGGDRGPAIVPGDPEKSLLIQAISYRHLDLKMPPNGKLPDEQIADLIDWVKMGAPDPRTAASAPATEAERKGIDLEEGRRFWSFRPIQNPTFPQIKQNDWPTSPIDRFILAKLEEKGLKPAPPADKRTWIRRVTFDLIGLPPAPEEIETFLSDDSTGAYDRVVDRLLASPHYGERWGRHWLDLVRFAETNGHEFDNDKLDAWRYRDYVIRAFNDDVPYNQFVREHIAGDLIAEKRISTDGSHWESPLGTNFYWFGEVLNSATDSVKSRADQVDNQIDVLSKAFLGLTVACARCHDHKFDPIPTSDYYALAGMMHSTDVTEAVVDAPARSRRIASARRKISDTNDQIRELIRPAQARLAERMKDYLLAVAEVLTSEKAEQPLRGEQLAKAGGLNEALLRACVSYVEQAQKEADHLFYPFAAAVEQTAKGGASFADALGLIRNHLSERTSLGTAAGKVSEEILYEDFEASSYQGWSASGQAFGEGPTHEVPPNQELRGFRGEGSASSFGSGSDKLVGSLTSVKFKMPKLYLHARITGSKEPQKGEKARLRLTIVADAHKSLHIVPDGNPDFQWKTVRLTKEIGRICYFEIVDRSREGHITVDKIVLSDSKQPPSTALPPNGPVESLLRTPAVTTLESLAEAYQRLFSSALARSRALDNDARSMVLAFSPTRRLEDLACLLSGQELGKLAELQSRRSELENEVPASAFAMVARDENPRNIRIHLRGNHKTLGEEVPRRFLQVIAGRDQPDATQGSGRLQLADWISNPENSLAARVMVNRVWKHHFGSGIVRSTDNFGRTGDRPTHPELLDYLAYRFREGGWSVKSIQRMILLSSTYRMSSQVDATAAGIDPENKLLHHMPVRRLEAEVIRDSILAVAGTLEPKLFGPGVLPHISKYQDGRGKPESGPLDGGGRRSVYIQVRRNFITPMFLAFDYPLPISTIGNRSVSTVPTQALLMMNNEFVALEAQEWARRIMGAVDDNRKRVERLYLTGFGRPPENLEIAQALQFVESQSAKYRDLSGSGGTEDVAREAWVDLCHVLLNSAEFIYVR
jgi:Protein of unknown function (DUF1553)/Protein of unknown function (DUF1549)/Planctomycete cytochrome C